MSCVASIYWTNQGQSLAPMEEMDEMDTICHYLPRGTYGSGGDLMGVGLLGKVCFLFE